MQDNSVKKIHTPEFRVSFPVVFQPKGFDGGEPKFSIVMLFDKAAQGQPAWAKMKEAAKAVAKEKWGDKIPANLKSPFRKGEEKADLDGYGEGVVFVSASSKQKPGLVDRHVQPVIDQGEFYAGCYARATLSCFAYDKAGNKGVSFGLQNIQKLRDGESFSGRSRAEDDFKDEGGDEPSTSAGSDFLD